MYSCPGTDIDPSEESFFPPWGSLSFPFLFMFFFGGGGGEGGGEGAGFDCLVKIPTHYYLNNSF